jgi:hypothetical protein
MDTNRKTAVIVGVLYIIGTVAGVVSVFVMAPVLNDPLVQFPANQNRVAIGALSVLIMALALAMVPVMMFPIFKKYNETLAIGYVVFRGALETVCHFLYPIIWLSLLTLGQEYIKVGAPQASYIQTLSTLLLGAGEWGSQILNIVFSLGALMFYYFLYQTKLIPRWISGWGLIGATLYLAWPLLTLFGTEIEFLFIPLALQEMVLAVWLIVKGFKPSAMLPDLSKQIKRSVTVQSWGSYPPA